VEQGMSAGGLAEKKLLLVIDPARDSGDLSGWLPHWLRTVETAQGGNQALQTLKGAMLDQEPFDGLILDTRSVALDPSRFAKQIKTDDTLQEVQLFAVTEGRDRSRELEAAGYECVFKTPLDKTLVFNDLHHALVRPVTGDVGVTRLVDYYVQPGEGSPLKLLLAEDNPVNQKVISKILERAGHEVDVVENGQQLLDCLEDNRFDLVICDMHMPVMDGIDAMKMHRFAQPDRHTPFLVLTANATTGARRECEEAGADGYLTKPIHAHALYEALDKIMEAQRASPIEFPGQENRGPSKAASLTKLVELKALSSDGAFVREIARVFMDDAVALLGQMESAHERNDRQEIKRAAHSFKGGAASIGAYKLCKISDQIIELSFDHPPEYATGLFRAMRRELEEVEKELTEFVEDRDTEISR